MEEIPRDRTGINVPFYFFYKDYQERNFMVQVPSNWLKNLKEFKTHRTVNLRSKTGGI